MFRVSTNSPKQPFQVLPMSPQPPKVEPVTRFHKSVIPDNKGSITFRNESGEPAQVFTNGRVAGTVPAGRQETFFATIGQTFVVNGLNVQLVQRFQLVFIPVVQQRPQERRLYPLSSNRNVSALKSIEAKTTTAITFVNETANNVNVDWIDYQGQRKRYKTLQRFETYRQTTFVTHPWEVIVDGRANIYLPTEQTEYIVYIGNTDNPTLIPLQGSEAVNLKSGTPNGPDTAVNFINTTNDDAFVFWINFQGERQAYRTLKPGTSYKQNGFTTNFWEVAFGSVKSAYALIDSESDVVIREQCDY